MKIHNAALYFNRDPVYDGYTGAFLFKAKTITPQAAASASDGSTYHRRTLETAPDVTLPARQVLQIYGDRWVVGNTTPDGFGGVEIRRHFTMKLATHLMHVLTPAQALAAAAGTQAYTQGVFYKDMPNTMTDSQFDTFWNFFFALGEAATKGAFLRDENGILYRVRNDYVPAEGLRVAQSDQLDAGCLVSATFDTGSTDPVTEIVTAGTAAVAAIFLEMPKLYAFTHISAPPAQPGDYSVLVPNSIAPKAGQTFTVGSVKWRVLAAFPENGVQAVHARRA